MSTELGGSGVSFSMRFRRRPTQPPTTAEDILMTDDHVSDSIDGSRVRTIAGRGAAAPAGLLVLLALVAPSEISRLTPGGFLSIPVEGLLGVALLLGLPAQSRRI